MYMDMVRARPWVLDYRPLQQGLRLLVLWLRVFLKEVLDYRPLQQGLRQDFSLGIDSHFERY